MQRKWTVKESIAGLLQICYKPLDMLQPLNAKALVMKQDEMILKTVKEIVVKFIEVGNISPSSFHDHFRNIYNTVEKSVRGSQTRSTEETEKK